MADEKPEGPGPVGDLIFVISIIGVLIVLWFAMGARKAADVRGLFLHPPAPVGAGGSYGPTLGTTSILDTTSATLATSSATLEQN
ncbi:MAG TPA: hypothetical protein VIJ88_00795 [Candidatus Paceibacterota bacterium]